VEIRGGKNKKKEAPRAERLLGPDTGHKHIISPHPQKPSPILFRLGGGLLCVTEKKKERYIYIAPRERSGHLGYICCAYRAKSIMECVLERITGQKCHPTAGFSVSANCFFIPFFAHVCVPHVFVRLPPLLCRCRGPSCSLRPGGMGMGMGVLTGRFKYTRTYVALTPTHV